MLFVVCGSLSGVFSLVGFVFVWRVVFGRFCLFDCFFLFLVVVCLHFWFWGFLRINP